LTRIAGAHRHYCRFSFPPRTPRRVPLRICICGSTPGPTYTPCIELFAVPVTGQANSTPVGCQAGPTYPCGAPFLVYCPFIFCKPPLTVHSCTISRRANIPLTTGCRAVAVLILRARTPKYPVHCPSVWRFGASSPYLLVSIVRYSGVVVRGVLTRDVCRLAFSKERKEDGHAAAAASPSQPPTTLPHATYRTTAPGPIAFSILHLHSATLPSYNACLPPLRLPCILFSTRRAYRPHLLSILTPRRLPHCLL